MRFLLLLIFLIGMGARASAAEGGIAVIGHPSLPKTDQISLQRLYTGRIVSINQIGALPVNLSSGDPVRKQFLESIIGQTDEQYIGYWLVRRYVGKGAPPQEFSTQEDLIAYVMATPGAVGYVPVSRVPAGANVIYRR